MFMCVVVLETTVLVIYDLLLVICAVSFVFFHVSLLLSYSMWYFFCVLLCA